MKSRVLFLEDSQSDTLMVKCILADFCEILHFAEMSLPETVLQMTFDAILTDLSLPGLLDEDAVCVLKKLFPDTPIIVLTGREDPATTEACLAAGAEAINLKGSCSRESLLISLETCLNSEHDVRPRRREGIRKVIESLQKAESEINKLFDEDVP